MRHLLILLLLALLVFEAKARGNGPVPGKPPCRSLRSPVLGLALERCAAGHYRVIDRSATQPAVLGQGKLERCEQLLVDTLRRRHGRGGPNLALPTLGGKQFWADVFVFAGWRIQEHVYTGHHRLLDPANTRRSYGSYASCRAQFEEQRMRLRLKPRSSHLVLAVHGLFRAKESFEPMLRALEQAGHDAQSVNYPSTRRSVAEHADQLATILANLGEYTTVSFVTHSLGGIVVRELLGRPRSWPKNLELGRVVMLGPPSRGSVIAETLDSWLPFRVIAGDSAVQLNPQDLARLPVPPCAFGIVAGGKGNPRGFNPALGGDNDGVVLVDNTRLDEAKDFLLVDEAHTFLMRNPQVIAATLRFLAGGRFQE